MVAKLRSYPSNASQYTYGARKNKNANAVRVASDNIQKYQDQATSAQKYKKYSDMDVSTFQSVYDINHAISKVDTFLSQNADTSLMRLESYSNGINSMQDIVNNAKQIINESHGMNNESHRDLRNYANDMLSQLQNIMNTNYYGKYPFGGNISTPPFRGDITDPSSYHRGPRMAAEMTHDGVAINYAITGDAPGIKKLIEGLQDIADSYDSSKNIISDHSKLYDASAKIDEANVYFQNYRAQAESAVGKWRSAISDAKDISAALNQKLDSLTGVSMDEQTELYNKISDERNKISAALNFNNQIHKINQEHIRALLGF